MLQNGALETDGSPASKYILSHSRKAQTWTNIDVDVPAGNGGVSRADITRKLDSWAESGIIKLSKTGVQKVFRVSKKLPSQQADIDEIIDNIDKEIVKKEKQDLQRVQDLVNLLTDKSCLTRGLATYFADTTHSSVKECGHCTWCETHQQVRLPGFTPKPLDEKAMRRVLAVCKEACQQEASKAKGGKPKTTALQTRQALANSTAKDDARFMACVAFGIRTPRVSSMSLHNNKAVFETMSTCNFNVSTFGEAKMTFSV